MKTGKRSKALLAFLIALVLLFVGTLINVRSTNLGGTVKVTRVTYMDDTDKIVSGVLYVPSNATSETPAPGALTNHGGGASSEAQSSYNIELARRGFVVLSWDASNSGSSEKSSDPTHGGEASFKFLTSLDFVDDSNIITSGHSMGGVYSYMVAQNHPENVRLEIAVGMNPAMNDTSHFDTNYVCLMGIYDESNLVRSDKNVLNLLKGDPFKQLFGMDSIEANTLYGSYEDRTARAFYTPKSSHAGAMINHDLLKRYLDTVQLAVKAPNPIDGDNQIWWHKDMGMIVQFVGLVTLMFSVASLLLDSKAFSSLILPFRTPVGYPEKSKMWWVSLLFLLFVPSLFFVPFTTIAQKVDFSKVLPLDATANGILIWSLLSSVLLILWFFFYNANYGKKHGGNLMTYGIATEADENKVTWKYLGKALAFAAIVIGGTYLAYLFMYEITGGDIHMWLATLRPVTMIRLKYFPIYLLLQAPFYICGTIAGRSISINNGDRTGGGGMRNSLIISLLIGILGLSIIFIMHEASFHINGTVLFPQNRGYIYTGAIFSMLPSFSVGNTINCYVTNRTNSIWAGLFAGIIWSAWVLVASNAIA